MSTVLDETQVINLTEYKTKEEVKLQEKKDQLEAICDKADAFCKQMSLKYDNLPEGTRGSQSEADEFVRLLSELSSAGRDVDEQKAKMGISVKKTKLAEIIETTVEKHI